MRGAGRRRTQQPPPQPPQPQFRHFNSSRDSDASYASSRPSSIGPTSRSTSDFIINDKSHQLSSIRTINSYLSSHSSPITLKLSPLPSAKDITETLKLIMARLDYPSNKLDEDLPVVLKQLGCPIKLNKSALKAPGTPHTWPTFLAVINWLVQIAMYNDYIGGKDDNMMSERTSVFRDNSMSSYALDSYLHYIRGDDAAVDSLDREFMEKLEQERDSVGENVKCLGEKVKELEGKLEMLRSGPSAREALEKEKGLLEEDVKKFKVIIGESSGSIAAMEKVLEEKEKELEVKGIENKRICEENEELRRAIESQSFNARDVERMKRELQAVERDINEAEVSRNTWEEKSYDLDLLIRNKFKELEQLSIGCNQAIKRLKLGNDLQYSLNEKGRTLAEVLGLDHKTTLKPALDSLANDIKKSSMEKLEELIKLQEQSAELATKIEGKRKHIAALQAHIDEVEGHLNLLKEEMQDYLSRCTMEAQKMVQDYEIEVHNMDIAEIEAAEMLKASKLNLQEVTKQCDEEIQRCAYELFALVDSISKYKEYVSSKVSEMKSALSDTAAAVSQAYKDSLPAQFGDVFNAK